MEEVKISFNVAKLAKVKGFNIGNDSSDDCYAKDGSVTRAGFLQYHEICYRPTQTLLQKWLREKHDIIVIPDFDVNTKDFFYWVITYGETRGVKRDNYQTYEEALEEALQVALNLIKIGENLQVSE